MVGGGAFVMSASNMGPALRDLARLYRDGTSLASSGG